MYPNKNHYIVIIGFIILIISIISFFDVTYILRNIDNHKVEITNIFPQDNYTEISISPQISFKLNDPDEDELSYFITVSSQNHTYYDKNIYNGYVNVKLDNLKSNTKYIWSLSVFDGKAWVNNSYVFHTQKAIFVDYKIIALTNNEYRDDHPKVYGNFIVCKQYTSLYEDAYSKILLYNISDNSTIEISDDPKNNWWPSIYGNIVAWPVYSKYGNKLMIYNVSSGLYTSIDDYNDKRTYDGDQYPIICDDIVVWEGSDGHTEIFLYYLEYERIDKVSWNGRDNTNPILINETVYWTHHTVKSNWETGHPEIQALNLSTHQRIYLPINNTFTKILKHYSETNRYISNNYIVYEASDEIYLYNIITKENRQITDNQYYDDYPHIHENIIVWSRHEDQGWNIFLHNITSEQTIQITDNELINEFPYIYENVLAWVCYDGNDTEVCYAIINK